MRVLAGSVCKQVPEVLRAHLQTLRWQRGNFTLDFAFIDDNDDAESVKLLNAHDIYVELAGPKDAGAEYEVSESTHRWTLPMFAWLGREKQRLIDYAKREKYDAILLVDSDLLLSPDTLSSLLDTQKEVVSSVFWTRWQTTSPPLPQVWLAHPYEFQGMGREAHEFLGDIAGRKLTKVAGLGACTLIRSSVFDRVAYWPLLEGLPNGGMWQGEDRHFCVRAQRNHVELWADPWPDVWHCYRPSDRVRIGAVLDDLYFDSHKFEGDPPSVGDLVSFTIQPLEEPNVAGYTEHVRGRLGALKILPEIENALGEMRVGQDRLIRVRYPLWYDLPEYRGVTKLLRIKLLGAKPFALAPTLDEVPFKERGVGAITEPFMGEAA